MGTAASKTVRGVAQKGAETAAAKSKEATKVVPRQQISLPLKIPPPTQSSAANPANFLRGSGVPNQRDIEQEQYLRRANRLGPTPTAAEEPLEMSQDLIKFLNDVGPAQKTVDEDRMYRKKDDINRQSDKDNATRGSSTDPDSDNRRRSRRQRLKMPLMDGDDTFTATRSTNFSHSETKNTENDKAQGRNVFEIFDHISRHRATGTVETVHNAQDDNATDDQDERHERQLLANVLKHVDIPVILKDVDGNLLGVHESQIDPDVRGIQRVGPDKLKLVLQDVIDITLAREAQVAETRSKSEQRRRERKQ